MFPFSCIPRSSPNSIRKICLAAGLICTAVLAGWAGEDSTRPAAADSKPGRAAPPAKQTPSGAAAMRNYGNLPLRFEANQGQTDEGVEFLSRGPGYTLFLTGEEAVLSLRSRQPSADANEIGESKSEKTKIDNSRFPSPESQIPSVVRMKLVGASAAAKAGASTRYRPGRITSSAMTPRSGAETYRTLRR
jgi:hypothetical protein